MSNELVGGLLRMVQGLGWSGPTLLVGIIVSGVFRYYLGTNGTRRLFGGETIRALPQSWLIGMLLPVCSIGVIPILIQMRRFGVRPGAMTAFALSAPLFNPLSLLYGITLSRPSVVISFALLSLFVVTILGAAWDHLRRRDHDQDSVTEAEVPIIGGRRLVAVLVNSCRETAGPTLLYAVVALLGLGVLGTLIPFGDLQMAFEQDDRLAPARMTALAIPVYATPMLAMTQLGMMFSHANSPGAALALLMLGTGINLGTMLWMVLHFGWRSTAIWFTVLVTIVVAMAYLVERPLIPPGVEPAGHTHAFDIYSNPFHAGEVVSWFEVRRLIEKQILLPEKVSAVILGIFLLAGCLLRSVSSSVDRWLQSGIDQPTENRLGASRTGSRIGAYGTNRACGHKCRHVLCVLPASGRFD